MAKLRDVLTLLITAEPIPLRLEDHPLTGEWRGYRNLHIEPDRLLLYKIDGDALILARTGTRADLFRLRSAFTDDLVLPPVPPFHRLRTKPKN